MPALTGPEERAYGLLLQHLNDEQKETFHKQGYVEFKAHERRWRVYTTEALRARGCEYDAGRLVRVDETQRGVYNGLYYVGYNVWMTTLRGSYDDAHALPECDTLLALKTHVETFGQTPTGCRATHRTNLIDKELEPGKLTKYPSWEQYLEGRTGIQEHSTGGAPPSS